MITKKQKILIGIALITALLFLVSFASAADTTPPIVSIYMSQDAAAGNHNDLSYKFNVTAHLFNNESVSYDVTACHIDWGEGAGWESVSRGSEGAWYMVSHVYSTSGLKTIRYGCQNDAGLWSNTNVQHRDWDSITIQIQPPATEIYLSQNSSDSSHNDDSYSQTIYAHLVNNHTLYSVDSCQIDWGDGAGWQDIAEGTEGVFYTLSYTYSDYGLKTVNYRCRNSQGAWSSGTALHSNFDTINLIDASSGIIPPAILVYSPVPSGNYANYVLLNATSNQNVNWIYNLNGAGNVSAGAGSMSVIYNITSGLVNGINTIIVYGTNANGTDSSAITFNFTSSGSLPDTTPPVITIISPVNGNTYTNATQLLNVSINEAGTIWYSVNGGANQTYTSPVYVSFANGTNTLRVWANDTSGNFNSAQITFTINTSGGSSDDDDDDDEDDEDDGDDEDDDRSTVVIRSKSTSGTSAGSANKTQPIELGSKKTSSISLAGKLIWGLIILIILMVAVIAFVAAAKFGA